MADRELEAAFPAPLPDVHDPMATDPAMSELRRRYRGMSLRDYFAGQVIGQLMIMERRQPEHDFTTVEARQRWYAAQSYRIADYMLAERAK